MVFKQAAVRGDKLQLEQLTDLLYEAQEPEVEALIATHTQSLAVTPIVDWFKKLTTLKD